MNQHFSLQRGEEATAVSELADLPTGALPLQHRERPSGSRLFDLGQLDVRWEAETGSLWTYMTPVDRPNFNRPMLRDFQRWQEEIRREFAAPSEGMKYLVLGSRFPGIFNLGGDLNLFASFIASGDRTGLVQYGRDCVSILHNNMRTLGLVHVLAEPGRGEEAVRAYIARNGRRQAGHRGIYRASALVDPITLDELNDVVEVWADAALNLTESELKMMRRLVDAQTRLAAA